MAWTNLEFHGDQTGLFYVMESTGTETVPVSFVDTTVTIGYHSASPSGQVITQPASWVNWHPAGGSLSIAFADGVPVRTIWIVTTQAEVMTPVIPVWASPNVMDLWKQSTPQGSGPSFHVFDFQSYITVMEQLAPPPPPDPHVYDFQAYATVMVQLT